MHIHVSQLYHDVGSNIRAGFKLACSSRREKNIDPIDMIDPGADQSTIQSHDSMHYHA